ncbi:phosphate-phosphoenolpyruvate translocator [Uncinocarpus reesii 1704]|uniref:Phosphate-phosphoenolpyruvate translocator n=1 Tax=Uncinocarpus reesii (strain UAMH 1704) TaxID=336963 RepID=C4JML3_UNCRE|nr:phosphate-phosphoenolpyruvate translocator [Uncinocarpus reesii 1704]EEP79225.1 phosphate-phosphoenolpyruvate translocator [Uncinocarpus reesii 1704]
MSVTTVLHPVQHPAISRNHKPQMNLPGAEGTLDKFPSVDDESTTVPGDANIPLPTGNLRSSPDPMWLPRKNGLISNGLSNGRKQRPPRKSIGEAIGSFKKRSASVSVNAQELAEALKAPVSYKLIGLCLVWYMTSALTNTSSKEILTALPKPITLTIVQFGFVSTSCLASSYLASVFPGLRSAIPALRNPIRYPSIEVLSTALPLALFQLAGHILSAMATSQIPVSLVHTIKGLSPLFTVLAYRFLFRIRYARATYLSLVPLTLGVMLACSSSFSTNLFGILCAFCAALVFVSQNIFSKKLFNEAARIEAEGQTLTGRKLDKLNLLCYCSGLAFILTAPIWFFSEGYPLFMDLLQDGAIDLTERKGSLDHGPLTLEFIFNGLSHFAQNILAFVLLSMISPVSYSVASLIKRVFVVVVAIVWFGNATTPIQALGIGLTFVGLYLYDRTSHEDAADRRANADHFHSRKTILPLNIRQPNNNKGWNSNGYAFPHPIKEGALEGANGYVSASTGNSKKDDSEPNGRPRKSSAVRPWMPPGTKQETTWHPGDAVPSQQFIS